MEAFKGVSCTKQACWKAKVDKGSVHTICLSTISLFLLLCFAGCQCLNCMGWLGFFTDIESIERLLLQILLLKTLQMPKMPKGHLKGHQEDLQI